MKNVQRLSRDLAAVGEARQILKVPTTARSQQQYGSTVWGKANEQLSNMGHVSTVVQCLMQWGHDGSAGSRLQKTAA